MDLVWLVYAISLLHGIGNLFNAIAAVSGCATLGFLIYRATDCTEQSWYDDATNNKRVENGKWAMKHVKTAIMVLISSMVILTFLPTEKTAYMMVGAYATQKVAESGAVQETGGKVLKLINQKLDSYVEEGIQQAEAAAEAATQPKKKRK